MPRVAVPHTNFLGGQIGPLAFNRVDSASVQNGAELLENIIVLPQGPAQNRGGSKYVSSVKTAAKKVRLIPFVFSTQQAYVLEFGDQYIRFYRNQGQIQSGGSPYEISSPYLEAELDQIQFTQSADVLYLAHPNHKPRKVTRTGHTSWTLANYAPTSDPFTSANNYPRAVCLYEERIVWAGTNTNPQKIFASVSQDFEDMTVGTAAGNGYQYTIASDQVNVIEWLFADTFLLVGTLGGIFVARGSGIEEAITPTNVFIRRHAGEKVKSERPVIAQDIPFFISRLGKKIHGLSYSAQSGKYGANEVSFKVRGLLENSVKQMMWQEDPNSIIWMAGGEGKLWGLTIELGEEVLAWHSHVLGGTDSFVESVCVIPEDEGDELWVSVRRTIDGSTVRYIEYFPPREDDTHEDFFYVDSGLTYSGAATDTLTGLDHLEGETVTILADGAWHPTRVVTSGEITLEREVTKAQVGLGYESTIKKTKHEGGSATGTALGKKKRLSKMTLHLYKTIGAQVGVDIDNLDTVPFRTGSDPMDNPPPLFTGDKTIEVPGGYNTEGNIIVKQALPMPLTVLGLTPRFTVNDG